MKKTVNIIYSIFAISIFIFSIIYFCFNIYSEYSTGNERTRRRFDHLNNTVTKISSEQNMNLLNSRLIKAIGDLDDYSYIEVTKNEKVLYSYNEDKKNDTSKLIKTFENSIKNNEDIFTIKCNLYVLRPSTIYFYARISFLIVLFITLVTLILILIVKNPSKSNNKKASTEIKTTIRPELDIDLNKTKTVENTETKSTTEFENTENVEKVKLPNEHLKPLDIIEDENYNTNPAGLFSPVTGFGWESYLLTRLDSELNRAIASEFDLALYIFKFPNIHRSDDRIIQICDYLLSHFQFKDLLFEYKDDSFVAIKISQTIDEAIEMADTIYKSVSDFIGNNHCYIGISSRTIRMINGERLLKEAEKALEIAINDKSTPIVAFRADAEKFRKFEESK